ncbi:MAG: demethylmenaquinone methyltransferase [Planctomycetaceae bacterium]|nr:MAG: demethylmenaquinone methyltransferase [Planctomycetaceae bacterium]
MFGEISCRYDLMNHLLSAGIDRSWRRRAVRECPPRGAAPILDVCTGTGDLALMYWEAGGGHVPVIGTDFTPEMLAIAEQKAQRLRARWERGQRNVNSDAQTSRAALTFQQADTLQLPFENDCFQIVSVAFGLRNVSDTERGLQEMVRVCRPGGRVCILEFSLPTHPWLRKAYLWYFQHVLPRVGQWLTRNQQAAYHYLPASVSEFPSGAQLAGLMERHGLTAVSWLPLTGGIATLYLGHKA